MDQLTTLGGRFGDYLSYHSIGINQAGRDLGISGAQISNITKGKNFSVSILFKIINTYSDLCLEWLLLGEGTMLYESPRTSAREKESSPAVSETRPPRYGRDAAKKLKECQQERDHLQIQVATYRDALDRLGRGRSDNDDLLENSD